MDSIQERLELGKAAWLVSSRALLWAGDILAPKGTHSQAEGRKVPVLSNPSPSWHSLPAVFQQMPGGIVENRLAVRFSQAQTFLHNDFSGNPSAEVRDKQSLTDLEAPVRNSSGLQVCRAQEPGWVCS